VCVGGGGELKIVLFICCCALHFVVGRGVKELYFMNSGVGILCSDQWICIIHGCLWCSFMV
jgi:hypothetical protein